MDTTLKTTTAPSLETDNSRITQLSSFHGIYRFGRLVQCIAAMNLGRILKVNLGKQRGYYTARFDIALTYAVCCFVPSHSGVLILHYKSNYIGTYES